jgi:Thioredoxin
MGEVSLVDAGRFATGLTYEQFKANMTRNLDALEEIEAGVKLDSRDVTHFRSLKPLHVVALVEDWCGDVIANLPVVAALAREVGPALDLRCFYRDQNGDLVVRYLNRGRFESIPVFACFDEDWREVGVLIERPVAVTERREDDVREIYADHPEFGSPAESPSRLPDEVRERLRSVTNDRRRGWRPWAERQLLLALRDCTARAPQVGERRSPPSTAGDSPAPEPA